MTGRWFSPGTPVSSTNKSDRYDITEILLKVALNTINQSTYIWKFKTSTYTIHILYLYMGSGFYIDILNFILSDELQQMKQNLQMIDKPKFGKARLEKVKNGVEVLPLLQERDLLGINNVSFTKNIWERINKNVLLREVYNYAKDTVEAVDTKPRPPKSGN